SSTEVDGVSTSGVDFWHAVEFSRNGRFLCTHPRDIRWGFPPGFRSVLAFPTLSDSFVSDFLGAFQVFAFAFSLSSGSNLTRTFPRRFRLGFELVALG
ncbi:hypothetical protein ABT224_12400, partial [Streptomyces sp. NPDC001584]|uniref:hypothetical protein n=1 Tax=Streptomyces sp. NPDC001584 TaxID=3154521 RepID=UPI003316F86E